MRLAHRERHRDGHGDAGRGAPCLLAAFRTCTPASSRALAVRRRHDRPHELRDPEEERQLRGHRRDEPEGRPAEGAPPAAAIAPGSHTGEPTSSRPAAEAPGSTARSRSQAAARSRFRQGRPGSYSASRHVDRARCRTERVASGGEGVGARPGGSPRDVPQHAADPGGRGTRAHPLPTGEDPGVVLHGARQRGLGGGGRDRDGARRRRDAAPPGHGRPRHPRRRAVAHLRELHGPRGGPAKGRDGNVHIADHHLGLLAMVSHLPAMLPSPSAAHSRSGSRRRSGSRSAGSARARRSPCRPARRPEAHLRGCVRPPRRADARARPTRHRPGCGDCGARGGTRGCRPTRTLATKASSSAGSYAAQASWARARSSSTVASSAQGRGRES